MTRAEAANRILELEKTLMKIEFISTRHAPNSDYARITDIIRKVMPYSGQVQQSKG